MAAAVAFVCSNAAAWVAAWLAVDAFLPRGAVWRRALATMVGFFTIVTLLEIALGSVGLLAPWPVTAGAALCAVAAALVGRRCGRYRQGAGVGPVGVPPNPACAEAEAPPSASVPSTRPERLLGGATIGALVAVLAAYAGYSALKGTQFIFDDFSYHAAQPAYWVRDGRLTIGLGDYQAYFPHNSELLSLWLMLPFRSDAHASLGCLLWVGLGCVAMLALAETLELPRATFALPALLLISSGVVLRRQSTFSDANLAAAALGLASVVLAMVLSDKRARGHIALAVYAGLAGGLAAGVKTSFVPVPVLCCVWVAVAALRARQGARLPLTYAAGALLTGLYWYAHNALLTGNPVFPARLGPLDGPFGPAEQGSTRLIAWLTGEAGPYQVASLAGYITDWPAPLLLLCALGYAFTVVLPRRPGLGRSGPALALGLALLAMFPWLPFSATWEWPGSPLEAQTRYLILVYALGIVLLAPHLRGRGRLTAGIAWLSVAAAAFSVGRSALSAGGATSLAMVGGLAALGAVAGASVPALARLWPRVCRLTPVLGLLALTAVALATPVRQRQADVSLRRALDETEWVEHGLSSTGVLEALDELPPDSRTAWFAVHPHLCYPFFGRRLQLEPVPVTPDGSPLAPLHERWRAARNEDWWVVAGSVLGRARSLDDLGPNLLASGVDYVVTTKWRTGEWPEQHQALENLSRRGDGPVRVRSIYDDGWFAIWSVGPR